jgi:hypothetical protein
MSALEVDTLQRTAAPRQYVLNAAAPCLFLMGHSPAPPEAVQLMQRLRAAQADEAGSVALVFLQGE